ncbi:MAG: T9SS type A sorting domain-containing protein [Flavobacteriales bacterium]
MKTLSYFKVALLSISLLAQLSARAQDPVQQWVKTFDGPLQSYDDAQCVAFDFTDASLVVAARVYDTEGQVNVAVIKYDANGEVVWSYIWDGPSSKDDTPWDIGVSSTGIIYVCGQSKTGDGYWESDAFILALESDGDYLWEDLYGVIGNFLDIGYELRVGADGSVYVAGNEDQGAVNNIYYSGLMLHYTTAGELDWVIQHNSSTDWAWSDTFRCITLDASENVIVGGVTTVLNTGYDCVTISYGQDEGQNWLATNPGALNDVSETVFDVISDLNGNVFALAQTATDRYEVVKYDVDGNYQWTFELVDLATNATLGNDYMHTDGAGNLYFTVNGSGDIVTTKLDPDGTVVWQDIWNGAMALNDEPHQITSDLAGNIYIAGRGGIGNGFYDMVMLSYSPSGELLWDINYDGPNSNNDEANGISVSPDGSTMYVVGMIRGFTANGDVGVIKYANTVDVKETGSNAFGIFPNPGRDVLSVNVSSGIAQKISIYTIEGKLIRQMKVNTSTMRIDLTDLSEGMYHITVTYIDGTTQVEKFAVN